MAVEDSILKSTRKILGLPDDDTDFDIDVITHINTAFSALSQLGVGPDDGWFVEDESSLWTDFLETELNKNELNAVRSYVWLRVRMLFDPPQTSYVVQAMEKQLEMLEFRLSVTSETSKWADPTPVTQDDELTELLARLSTQVIDS